MISVILMTEREMMKYEYGVEYETNGEKPNLPDDVLVEFESKWAGWLRYGDGYDAVKNWIWEISTAFKIYDERYKPKEQEMNNDWYEKDELPPFGTECEYIIGEHRGRYKPCTFVGLNSRGSIVIETDDGEYLSYHNYQIKFRPLCTETNKLIEQMMFHGCQSLNRKEATELVEKGYRKIKQMSEQEFMKQCVDICGYGDARLYRADCRFIEQVKV